MDADTTLMVLINKLLFIYTFIFIITSLATLKVLMIIFVIGDFESRNSKVSVIQTQNIYWKFQ